MSHPFVPQWQCKPFHCMLQCIIDCQRQPTSCHLPLDPRIELSTQSRFIAAIGNAQVTYFVNSGSEANDLALRIASCAASGATHVAIMAGAYHGHTKAIIDLSPYKYDGPGGEGQQPHVHVLPCPDPYRCPSFVLQSSALCFAERVTTLIASSCRDEPNMQREL